MDVLASGLNVPTTASMAKAQSMRGFEKASEMAGSDMTDARSTRTPSRRTPKTRLKVVYIESW